MTKAPGSYLHGEVVIVPIRVAAIIAKHAPLSKWRIDARSMEDVELYRVLNDLHVGATNWNDREGTPLPPTQHTPASADIVTVPQAATMLGLKERGVRDACQRGRLEGAVRFQGRWQIPLASIRQYKAA